MTEWEQKMDCPATPALIIDEIVLRRNIKRMADYARSNNLALRPHTKTHKSLRIGRMQLSSGASGLTVAKAGEAQVFAPLESDLLLAYPALDTHRAKTVAELARKQNLCVAVDSTQALDALQAAAEKSGSTIGILVDLDVGMHRTGVQSPADAMALAQEASRRKHLRLDGLFFYPGHVCGTQVERRAALKSIDAVLEETISLWQTQGLEARIVSGGSTPTALDSHVMKQLTEIRPGTYVFNDMNCVMGGSATLDDCAARIVCTVVSNAVPGQVVIDAGTKILTSDQCGPAPKSGHGYIVEYPLARISKLTEEHGQVDISKCDVPPRIGERVTVIPNHICPCINLQDRVWMRNESGVLESVSVDARGKIQ